MTIETLPLSRTDAILTISNECMQRIVTGEKNYDFRRYLLPNSIKRIWFFVKAPTAQIAYVCEIEPAVHRPSPYSNIPRNNLFPLPLDGVGNLEFNLGENPAIAGIPFAYFIRSVYRLTHPVTLSELRKRYMLAGAPKGPAFAPQKMLDDVDWLKEEKILERAARKRGWETQASVVGASSGWVWRGGETTVILSEDDTDDDMDIDEVNRGVKRVLEDEENVYSLIQAHSIDHDAKRTRR